MMVEQRVFFASEQEALSCGYRPCGHCLREKYRQWKETSATGSGSARDAGTANVGSATGDSGKTVAAQKPEP